AYTVFESPGVVNLLYSLPFYPQLLALRPGGRPEGKHINGISCEQATGDQCRHQTKPALQDSLQVDIGTRTRLLLLPRLRRRLLGVKTQNSASRAKPNYQTLPQVRSPLLRWNPDRLFPVE